MKLLRIAAVAALVIAGALSFGSPARAGAWATTLLDPLPDRLEVGRAYTVGFWVLQHGSHPYSGDLGETGLKLVDEAGNAAQYPGRPLPEAAHYAAAVVFPHAGSWRLYGIQGVFAEYEIGTASVPGGLAVLPTPQPMTMDDGHDAHWGAIQPPITLPEARSATTDATPGAAASMTSSGSGSSRWLPPVIVGAAAATLGLLVLGWRHGRLRSRVAIQTRH